MCLSPFIALLMHLGFYPAKKTFSVKAEIVRNEKREETQNFTFPVSLSRNVADENLFGLWKAKTTILVYA